MLNFIICYHKRYWVSWIWFDCFFILKGILLEPNLSGDQSLTYVQKGASEIRELWAVSVLDTSSAVPTSLHPLHFKFGFCKLQFSPNFSPTILQSTTTHTHTYWPFYVYIVHNHFVIDWEVWLINSVRVYDVICHDSVVLPIQALPARWYAIKDDVPSALRR